MLLSGWNLKSHPLPIPADGKGHLSLDQVAQVLVQTGLKHFQGWGIHNFPGQSDPACYHSHSEKISS